jgi:hypothetical protein
MKYLLTQEEYDALQEKKRKITEDAQKILQDLCTRVANSEPVKEGWYAGKPWGCILTTEEEWYCDDCPVQKVCPKERKRYSK